MAFNPMWIPAIIGGIGALGNLFGGGKGDPIEQQPVDPELQKKYIQLLNFFLGKMNNPATQLPSNMPISATPHPNIGGASDIYRAMAGMMPLTDPNQAWGYGQGVPFQYAGFLPTPVGQGTTKERMGTPPFDPYDPRSINRGQLRQRA
jgi:hypothetical protein